MSATIDTVDTWGDVFGFAQMMIDAWEFVDAKEIQEYYEKPDHWYHERKAWIDAERPIHGSPGWELWTKRLEKMLNGEADD